MLVVKLLDTLPISRDIMIQFDGEWVAFVGLTNVYRILRVSAFSPPQSHNNLVRGIFSFGTNQL
ncbi:hypothetical protein K439DRAFT_1640244, partial [Ramaria rubella]